MPRHRNTAFTVSFGEDAAASNSSPRLLSQPEVSESSTSAATSSASKRKRTDALTAEHVGSRSRELESL